MLTKHSQCGVDLGSESRPSSSQARVSRVMATPCCLILSSRCPSGARHPASPESFLSGGHGPQPCPHPAADASPSSSAMQPSCATESALAGTLCPCSAQWWRMADVILPRYTLDGSKWLLIPNTDLLSTWCGWRREAAVVGMTTLPWLLSICPKVS